MHTYVTQLSGMLEDNCERTSRGAHGCRSIASCCWDHQSFSFFTSKPAGGPGSFTPVCRCRWFDANDAGDFIRRVSEITSLFTSMPMKKMVEHTGNNGRAQYYNLLFLFTLSHSITSYSSPTFNLNRDLLV